MEKVTANAIEVKINQSIRIQSSGRVLSRSVFVAGAVCVFV